MDKSRAISVCTIILHYLAMDMTIQAINSIKAQELKMKYLSKIIVVDNASPDNSGIRIREMYKCDIFVDVILLPNNLGYSKGNNVGFEYACKKYNPDFIILMNNDIVIEQNDFFQIMTKIYKREKFSVCGPDIWAVYKKEHQNPHGFRGYTFNSLKEKIRNLERKIKIYSFLDKTNTYKIARRISSIMRVLLSRFRHRVSLHNTQWQNVVLSGAFLIFSREYIREFPQGLFPETFMYMEEDILYYLCMKRDLKLLYTPEIQVLHFECVSTRKQNGGSFVKKSIFEFTWTIDSAQKFLQLMYQYEKEYSK